MIAKTSSHWGNASAYPLWTQPIKYFSPVDDEAWEGGKALLLPEDRDKNVVAGLLTVTVTLHFPLLWLYILLLGQKYSLLN